MSLHRVPPILQSVAQVRNWVVENVPCADSMLGYDLFLKLGNDVVAGQPLEAGALAAGLPYSREQVAAQLRRLEQAGLVEFIDGEDGELRPTQLFLTLLDRYSRAFESVFIVRQELRSQQLRVTATDPDLAALGRVLYDRVYDMGWLYLHNFGSACFLMASIVRRLAEAHGHSARIASCYVEVSGGANRYLLGAQGFAKQGQIDGHAVCVIDEKVIIDFGLGNIRKNYRRDFAWGAVSDYRREGVVLGTMLVPSGETVAWKDDWQSPGTEAELARYAPHIEGLFADYAERFR
jgi:DNA-binding transcriptional ArsR family regulator